MPWAAASTQRASPVNETAPWARRPHRRPNRRAPGHAERKAPRAAPDTFARADCSRSGLLTVDMAADHLSAPSGAAAAIATPRRSGASHSPLSSENARPHERNTRWRRGPSGTRSLGRRRWRTLRQRAIPHGLVYSAATSTPLHRTQPEASSPTSHPEGMLPQSFPGAARMQAPHASNWQPLLNASDAPTWLPLVRAVRRRVASR